MIDAEKLEDLLRANARAGNGIEATREVMVYDLEFKHEEAGFILHANRALYAIGTSILVSKDSEGYIIGLDQFKVGYRRQSVDLVRLMNEVMKSGMNR